MRAHCKKSNRGLSKVMKPPEKMLQLKVRRHCTWSYNNRRKPEERSAAQPLNLWKNRRPKDDVFPLLCRES